MKTLVLVLVCIVTLGLVACSSPATAPAHSVPSAPAAALPSAPTLASQDEVTKQVTTTCTDTIDPHVMTAAFPSSFEGLSVTGDVVADKTNTPTGDGSIELTSSAVKTLTKDDNYYLTFGGTDSCGLNVAKAAYHQLVVGTNDDGWVKATTVKGYSGLLVYTQSQNSYSFELLLKDRLSIQITADDPIGEDALMRAANQVDYAKIEAAMP